MKSLSPAQRRSRWWILGVVAVTYVLSFFQRFAPAGIAQDLAASFQTSAASLGVLAATYFYVYTVMQIPTGILADTLGPRRILVLGCLIGGIGSFLFGFAPTLDQALLGRTLVGLGVSVTFIAMLKLVAVWFEENRFATLVGVCMLIGNLGSVLAGAPLSTLAQITGWRGVFVGVGAVSLVLGVLCWIMVRDSPQQHEGGSRPVFDRTVVISGLLSVIRNRATWPAALVNTGMSGAFFTFAGLWATPYLVQVHGLSRAVATTHLSLWFGGFAIGCFFIGTISDRLGRRKPVLIVTSHVFVAIWLVLLSCITMPLPLSYALFALMGLSTAGFSLTWACAKEVNPPLLSGMSTSVANMGGFMAGALLQPLVGWVMDRGWQGAMVSGARFYDVAAWQAGVLVVTLCAAMGAAATWWLVETGCRNIWKSD
ncbi:MFS transporter [Dechloromonas sp. TW-R-39-2]|uniref:MFS transporter n=1 Tax=Dechloromonas sp. TW-R-39-2 TaxID=2654218 RepID=UPI00193E97E2|nr:MFS transporter [Dechloromonas sp. TW-R-39-2]QRM18899.1 MFS transporter [Dechloromonas sp. TW-R-39-2]